MSWRWLLWLLPVYLIGLVVLAPAQLVGWGLQQFGGGMVQVQNLSGTIWNGKGGLTRIILPTGTALELENIEWGVSPLLLLKGELGLNFEIPQAGNVISGSGQLQLTGQGLPLFEAELQGNIAQSAAALNLPLPLTIDGDWQLDLTRYSLNDFSSPGWCDTLRATVLTEQVRVRLNSVWRPLGDFRADLDCGDPQTINVSIPSENLLGLQVDAAVHGTRSLPRVRLQGSIRPTLETPAEVSELLVLIGQADASGRYTFSFNL
ncbi:type II secretion system protein N [Pseudidiomarina sp.]|uniref:type II secretion system protein N n=1 Tax=Pseudidiomarina sp. TaxID=2081707 RepID=UPI00299E74C7|nr:type II secretion system protein N [Pseudidiomarina sp.]MDX1706517.1 type II secretion system protein N [Pseudidiomarina sp.]